VLERSEDSNDWNRAFFVPASGLSGNPDLDSDDDGVKNLLEYFCGGNPLVSDSGGVSGGLLQNSVVITAFHDPDAMDAEARVIYSDDLQNWQEDLTAAQTSTADCVEFLIPLDGSKRRGFCQLIVRPKN